MTRLSDIFSCMGMRRREATLYLICICSSVALVYSQHEYIRRGLHMLQIYRLFGWRARKVRDIDSNNKRPRQWKMKKYINTSE